MYEHACRLAFRLKLIEGTVHLNYRHTPENGPIRYYIGFSENRLSLSKQVRDEFSELMAVDASYSLLSWHFVEIAGWGDHIAVYVDSNLELQYIDADFLPGGTFAFETLDNSHAQIYDIEVGEPGEEPEIIGQP